MTILDRIRRRADLRDDSGMSLMEVIVGMAVMTIFMAIFTGSMLMMSNTVNKVQAMTASSGQVNNAFLGLDKSLRYASGVNTPAQSTTSGAYHVEFQMVKADGTNQCVQLRLANSILQKRTWTLGSDGSYSSGSLTSWSTMASNVGNGGANPFSIPTGTGSSYQQLRINLTGSSGSNPAGTTVADMTFTALNSDVTSTASVCQQVSVDQTS